MDRISLPSSDIKSNYDVLVVGSGYGGGIAASRMARAGQSVALFERGREMIPGEYPDTPIAAAKEMQMNTPDGHIGSRLGMFEFHVNKDMNALVGCGLGGTSLINANVSLRVTDFVWQDTRWPQAIRDDLHTGIEHGYLRAEKMLGANPYPASCPPLKKTEAKKNQFWPFLVTFLVKSLLLDQISYEFGQNGQNQRISPKKLHCQHLYQNLV